MSIFFFQNSFPQWRVCSERNRHSDWPAQPDVPPLYDIPVLRLLQQQQQPSFLFLLLLPFATGRIAAGLVRNIPPFFFYFLFRSSFHSSFYLAGRYTNNNNNTRNDSFPFRGVLHYTLKCFFLPPPPNFLLIFCQPLFFTFFFDFCFCLFFLLQVICVTTVNRRVLQSP